jgi:hypothetical protein
MPPAGRPETRLVMSDAVRTRLLEDDCRRLVEANEFLEHLLAASGSVVQISSCSTCICPI